MHVLQTITGTMAAGRTEVEVAEAVAAGATELVEGAQCRCYLISPAGELVRETVRLLDRVQRGARAVSLGKPAVEALLGEAVAMTSRKWLAAALLIPLALGEVPIMLGVLILFHALTSWHNVVPHYAATYAWRIDNIPYRAALRITDPDECARMREVHEWFTRNVDWLFSTRSYCSTARRKSSGSTMSP